MTDTSVNVPVVVIDAAAEAAPRRSRRRWSPHLLAAGDFAHTCRILWRYGRQIDRRYLSRAAAIPVVSLLHTPFAVAEHLLTAGRIRRQPLADPLLMIIGHWRSGTTNLHNYLLQDPQFGCVSLLHCLAPHEFLSVRWLSRRLLRHFIFARRPMDRMKTGLDEPMSEDFALVGVTDQTHYLGYFFPRLLEQTFRETVLFDNVSQERIDRWLTTYERLLQKVTLVCEGRPLVLKNPANTGRIRTLLRRFPQMKFVFVRRNPFEVHASTCRLMERFLDHWSLQQFDRAELARSVLRRHALLLERYFKDRALIPEGQLVEVRHEDMVADPVATVERIYSSLGLGDFARVRPAMQQYAASVADYRTNEYAFDPQQIGDVREALRAVIDRWGYSPPAAGKLYGGGD